MGGADGCDTSGTGNRILFSSSGSSTGEQFSVLSIPIFSKLLMISSALLDTVLEKVPLSNYVYSNRAPLNKSVVNMARITLQNDSVPNRWISLHLVRTAGLAAHGASLHCAAKCCKRRPPYGAYDLQLGKIPH